MKVDFIVLAAGKGKRMGQGDTPKVLLPLAGIPIAQHLLNTISSLFLEIGFMLILSCSSSNILFAWIL